MPSDPSRRCRTGWVRPSRALDTRRAIAVSTSEARRASRTSAAPLWAGRVPSKRSPPHLSPMSPSLVGFYASSVRQPMATSLARAPRAIYGNAATTCQVATATGARHVSVAVACPPRPAPSRAVKGRRYPPAMHLRTAAPQVARIPNAGAKTVPRCLRSQGRHEEHRPQSPRRRVFADGAKERHLPQVKGLRRSCPPRRPAFTGPTAAAGVATAAIPMPHTRQRTPMASLRSGGCQPRSRRREPVSEVIVPAIAHGHRRPDAPRDPGRHLRHGRRMRSTIEDHV